MNKHLEHLQATVKQAPINPGVYQWKNEKGTVLYVGKAKNLRNRLKQYVANKPDATDGPWKRALKEH